MSKINKQQAQEIIDKFISGSGVAELSKEYGIWGTTIGNILRGNNWKTCRRPNNIQETINKQHKGRVCKILPPFTDLQNDILIGSLLGDGDLHKLYSIRSNSSFSKLQVHTKKSYLDWHFDSFIPYSDRLHPVFSKEKMCQGIDKIDRIKVPEYLSAYRFYTCRHPNFTELRKKWYPKGIKRVPDDLELNPQRISIWFFDDGSNNVKQRSATICTNSFTKNEVEFLSKKLNDFDLFPTIVMQKPKYSENLQPILKFHSKSYNNLIALIKPYMLWDCFAYKTEWRPAKRQYEVSGLFSDQQVKEIIELRKTKTAREISLKFNVHVNHIYEIVSGRTYKHIPREVIYARRQKL